MPRTTLNIDGPILREVKSLRKKEGKSLGQLVSELLARALSALREREPKQPGFRWISRPMHERVDLRDKEAVRAALERDKR